MLATKTNYTFQKGQNGILGLEGVYSINAVNNYVYVTSETLVQKPRRGQGKCF
jgi:hypothetical protein